MKTKKTHQIFLLLGLLLLFAATISSSSAADNIYVNNATGNDSWDGTNATYQGGTVGPKATIQNGTDTVDNAGNVHVADGIYQEHISINKNVNLIGQSQSGTIIDGTNNGLPVRILSGTVTLTKFTIQNGRSTLAGGIYNSDGIVTVNDCLIQQNTATGLAYIHGGGIKNYGTITLNNCVIQQNTATGTTASNGGGIGNDGFLTINNCIIQENTATGTSSKGGGIYNDGNTCTMTNSIITKNTAYMGGGVFNSYGTVSVDNCEITSNTAQSTGGGIFSDHGTLNIMNSVINGNTAQYAAAIDCRDDETSKITIKNTRIENNIGTNDGAIQNYCDMTIENCVISGNRANSRNGGAIVNYNDGILTVKNTVFQNNFAGRNGGVIYNENYRNVLFTDCKFIDNTAEHGGAIYSDLYDRYTINPTFNVISSLLSGNTATISGGAVETYNGPMVLNFNRIIGNTAPSGSNIYNWPQRGTTNALYNWWGSNAGPDPLSLVNVAEDEYDPWLVMNYSANPTTIPQGATSTLTADFRYDSDGTFHDPTLGHLIDGTLVTFTTNLGNVGSKSTVVGTLNGIATAILRGDEAAGEALTSASLDSQTLYATVTITAAANAATTTAVSGNTVGMQSTGIPIAGMILAILMVLGGFIGTRKQ